DRDIGQLADVFSRNGIDDLRGCAFYFDRRFLCGPHAGNDDFFDFGSGNICSDCKDAERKRGSLPPNDWHAHDSSPDEIRLSVRAAARPPIPFLVRALIRQMSFACQPVSTGYFWVGWWRSALNSATNIWGCAPCPCLED